MSARDERFFRTEPIDTIAFIWDEDSNVGMFERHEEQEDVKTTNTFIGNQKVVRVRKYLKDIPLSWEMFKTDQVSKRERIGKQVGDRARLTQDFRAILDTYGDAFSGSVNTTPDGANFASNAHVTLTGVTVDNLETGSLSPDNLWTLVNSLASQKAQDGDAGSYVFENYLCPFTLYKRSKEVLNSTLIADSAENNINIFDTDFGEVVIKASIFLNSTYNTAANANTSYHVSSTNHAVYRKVLADLSTTMVEPQYSRTDSYELRAKFAETSFPGTFSGYAASNGSV